MGEEPTESICGDFAGIPEGTPAGVPGGSGYVTTKVAAEALGVNPRTVRAYIERGDLVAKAEGEGGRQGLPRVYEDPAARVCGVVSRG